MIKELVKDEAVLSKKCTRATAEDEKIAQDLIDTMKSIEDCACLAANHIGETVEVRITNSTSATLLGEAL